MDYRSRDRERDRDNRHREDILLETNFDEDGALTTAHTTNQQNCKSNNSQYNAPSGPFQRNNGRRSFYRSDTSIDRYSEYSLHGRREKGTYHIDMTVVRSSHGSAWNYTIMSVRRFAILM